MLGGVTAPFAPDDLLARRKCNGERRSKRRIILRLYLKSTPESLRTEMIVRPEGPCHGLGWVGE
jgi:hypothetical protein